MVSWKVSILVALVLTQSARAQQAERTETPPFTLPEDTKTNLSIENGAALFRAMGCATCHAISGSREGKIGPSLGGVYGKNRTFMDGSTSVANDEYLRESIVDPTKRTLQGYDLEDINMPPYHLLLTDPQVESLLLFIKSLEPLPMAEDDEEKEIVARFDPPDQPFRRAPMPQASRSIVVPVGSDVHIAFDSKLMRTHTVWKGRGLALYGPPYSNSKAPHICKVDGDVLWQNPPFFPWSVGHLPTQDQNEVLAGSDFKAIKSLGGNTVLHYLVGLPGGARVSISEHTRVEPLGESVAIIRQFEIGPCDQDLWFLAHAEMGRVDLRPLPERAKAVLIQRAGQRQGDHLLILARGHDGLSWEVEAGKVAYDEAVLTDENTETGREFRAVSGHQVRAFLGVPAHKTTLTIEVLSTVCSEESMVSEALNAETMRLSVRAALPRDLRGAHDSVVDEALPLAGGIPSQKLESQGVAAPEWVLSPRSDPHLPITGDRHYRIEPFLIPPEVDLLVGGMDWLSNGDLAVATWAKGEVWILENATGPVHEVRFRRFAQGLMEPLGLKVLHDVIYVTQKGELTRLLDTDQDGEADVQECVNDDWGFSGNYHSYAFGPTVGKDGAFYVMTCGQRARWDVPFAGWALRIDPISGKLSGFAKGLRVPNGACAFGPEGDIFATDNQGNWVGACKINHIVEGKSYGFSNSYPAPRERWDKPLLEKQPAVWLPYHLSPSASGIATIETNAFGPFKGQMLVGDFQFGAVQRVYLEKVNGVWQGAVWPFASGFNGPVNRLSMGPDGRLYAGGCRRTWPAAKPQEYSLDRVTFTGVLPFEVKRVQARADGFALTFTEPIVPSAALAPGRFSVSQFTYRHIDKYGSPIINHAGQNDRETELPVTDVQVSGDRRILTLKIENLRAGFVTKVSAPPLRNTAGAELRHPSFYYTLNEIPR